MTRLGDDLGSGRRHLTRDWSPSHGSFDPAVNRGLIRLGEAVYEARRLRCMTQRVFAERCGLDQPTISRLERGMLSGLSLRRLARLLGAVDGILAEPSRMRLLASRGQVSSSAEARKR